MRSTIDAVSTGLASTPTAYIVVPKIARAGLTPVLCKMAGVHCRMKKTPSRLSRLIAQSNTERDCHSVQPLVRAQFSSNRNHPLYFTTHRAYVDSVQRWVIAFQQYGENR